MTTHDPRGFDRLAYAGALLRAIERVGIELQEDDYNVVHRIAHAPDLEFSDAFLLLSWFGQAHSNGIARISDQVVKQRLEWEREEQDLMSQDDTTREDTV